MSLPCFRLALVAITLCGHAAVAFGQTDPKEAARVHFDRGFSLATKGAYAEAIAEFNQAYQLSPHFAVLFNLGQAYAASGQPVLAADTLRKYLVDGGSQVPPALRKRAEEDIVQQERLIARLSTPEKTLATSPAETPASAPAANAITAVPNPAPAATPLLASPSRSVPVETRSRPTTAGLVVGGLGVVAGGLSVALLIWNKSRYDDWSTRDRSLAEDPRSANHTELQKKNDDLARSIRSTSVATVATAIAGAALLGTGIVLYTF